MATLALQVSRNSPRHLNTTNNKTTKKTEMQKRNFYKNCIKMKATKCEKTLPNIFLHFYLLKFRIKYKNY